MTDISEYRKHVRLEAQACPTPIIDREIIWAAREFCHHTLSWREDIETERLRENRYEVDIEKPSNGEIVTVDYVSYAGVDILPTAEHELDEKSRTWRTDTGDPYAYLIDVHSDTFRFYPIPSSSTTGLIKYRAFYKPKNDATEIPDFIYRQYLEVITAGALSMVFDVAGQSWTNHELALLKRRKFEAGISSAIDRKARNYTKKSLRIKSRRFA